jgi:hypothetical protein
MKTTTKKKERGKSWQGEIWGKKQPQNKGKKTKTDKVNLMTNKRKTNWFFCHIDKNSGHKIEFKMAELYNLSNLIWMIKSSFMNKSLSCCAAGVSLRKFLPIPTNSRVFPTLSCINFRVWGLILRSLINFELILV